MQGCVTKRLVCRLFVSLSFEIKIVRASSKPNGWCRFIKTNDDILFSEGPLEFTFEVKIWRYIEVLDASEIIGVTRIIIQPFVSHNFLLYGNVTIVVPLRNIFQCGIVSTKSIYLSRYGEQNANHNPLIFLPNSYHT